MWQTAGLPIGRYRLRLTLYVDGDTGAYPTDEYPVALDFQAVFHITFHPGRGPFKPWFLRVVRNRCIDLLRRRRPTGVDVELLPDPGVSPVDRVQKQERDASLRRALGALNPDHRQVLVLRDYLDLSYAEIAAVLDVAPGTVMSRLHRARMNLKEQLEDDDE